MLPDDIAPTLHPRILGLDVGSKTIGLAVSDPLGITAQGLETIRRKNKRADLEQLARIVRDYQVSEIVVGYPLRLSGAEGTQSEKMQHFDYDPTRSFRAWLKTIARHAWSDFWDSRQRAGAVGGSQLWERLQTIEARETD